MTGVQMIAAERARQVAEGYTAARDDEENRDGELALAAETFLQYARYRIGGLDAGEAADDAWSMWWPWERSTRVPTKPIDALVRAGALIAAEIDRLQRLER